MKQVPTRFDFDAAYYQRFYLDPRTRVAEPADIEIQARLLCSYLDYLRIHVRRILDLGCGLGRLRDPLLARFPRARYTGVEVSEHLCAELGWVRDSVVTFRSRRRFDLVICQDVLQYLDDPEAELALQNLARLCRGALWFGALTREDWEENCDQARTDGNGYVREGSWYRRRLAPAFVCAGAGVFVARRAGVVMFELDRAE
ncbi:MAG: methyltransferase [Chromatiales bacterium]|nr:methyltransferase [Chromatiales bacterium]